MIEGYIELTIADIRGNQVRLGITAPGDIHVYSKEATSIPANMFQQRQSLHLLEAIK